MRAYTFDGELYISPVDLASLLIEVANEKGQRTVDAYWLAHWLLNLKKEES